MCSVSVSSSILQLLPSTLCIELQWRYLVHGIRSYYHQCTPSQHNCPHFFWFIQSISKEHEIPWRLHLHLLPNTFWMLSDGQPYDFRQTVFPSTMTQWEVSEDLGVHHLLSARTELIEVNLDSTHAAFLSHFEQCILLLSAYVYFCMSSVLM
jgi:hypothetical protein